MLHKHTHADLSLLHSSVFGPVGQTVSDVLLQGFSYCRLVSTVVIQNLATYTVRIKAIIEFVDYRSGNSLNRNHQSIFVLFFFPPLQPQKDRVKSQVAVRE